MADPAEPVIATTRRRLTLWTLALIACLLVAMSIATAVVAIAQLDSGSDGALRSTAQAVLTSLEGQLPAAGGGADEGAGGDEPVGSADSFALVLDSSGKVLQNVRGVHLAGLPDRAALAAALAHGTDLRTVRAGGVPVRLLTLAIRPRDGGGPVGAVQAGLVLALHDQQVADIVRTIALVALAGLIGAALLAVLVTDRALVPIRAAFATERQFAAAASHELRTPAALIRASGEVLEREGLVRDEGLPLVGTIVSEADRLGRLVAGLLTLSTSRADPGALRPEPLDLAALAVDAATRMGPLAADRGCVIEVTPDPPPPLPVLGDGDRLIQALLVLLDNATRHSPPGTPVVVGLERSADHARISVSDRGPGVPAADRARIFEPFAQVGGSKRRRGEGTGLGLAVARSLVQQHHGSIAVDDAPRGGARFTVTVPLRQPTDPPGGPAAG